MDDVFIIGGGLAGSSLGILLRQKGWRVTIADKSSADKLKVCGEFLAPPAWPFFLELNLENEMLAAGGNFISYASLNSKKSKVFPFPNPNNQKALGYGLSRSVLDPLLFKRAGQLGCMLLPECEVRNVSRLPGGYEISLYSRQTDKMHHIHSKIVIDASGRPNETKEKARIGFKAHFSGSFAGDGVHLYFFQGGYFGIAGIEKNQTNLCGIITKKALLEKNTDFDEILRLAAEQYPKLHLWLSNSKRLTPWTSCPIPAQRMQPVSRNEIFSIGDKACFIEPFLGQGMTMAFASASLLSEILGDQAPALDRLSVLAKQYEKKLKTLYFPRAFLSRLINKMLPVLVDSPLWNWFPFLFEKGLELSFLSPFPQKRKTVETPAVLD